MKSSGSLFALIFLSGFDLVDDGDVHISVLLSALGVLVIDLTCT